MDLAALAEVGARRAGARIERDQARINRRDGDAPPARNRRRGGRVAPGRMLSSLARVQRSPMVRPAGLACEADLKFRTAFLNRVGEQGGRNPEQTSCEMLKVELHSHTADDPIDAIPYSTFELIDHAA